MLTAFLECTVLCISECCCKFIALCHGPGSLKKWQKTKLMCLITSTTYFFALYLKICTNRCRSRSSSDTAHRRFVVEYSQLVRTSFTVLLEDASRRPSMLLSVCPWQSLAVNIHCEFSSRIAARNSMASPILVAFSVIHCETLSWVVVCNITGSRQLGTILDRFI